MQEEEEAEEEEAAERERERTKRSRSSGHAIQRRIEDDSTDDGFRTERVGARGGRDSVGGGRADDGRGTVDVGEIATPHATASDSRDQAATESAHREVGRETQKTLVTHHQLDEDPRPSLVFFMLSQRPTRKMPMG